MVTIEVDDDAIVSPAPGYRPTGDARAEQPEGGQWLATEAGLSLPVPPAVVAGWDYVLNVEHPQASTHLSVVHDVPAWLDRRLVVCDFRQ